MAPNLLTPPPPQLRFMFKCVQCCLWCFEKVLKFITRNAYIVIAVEGKSFCGAAVRSFRLIMSNLALIGTVNAISMFVMILGKTVTTVAAGIGAFAWFTYDPSFDYGGANEVSGYAVPVLVRGRARTGEGVSCTAAPHPPLPLPRLSSSWPT